jgi:hypothetical protein
MITKEKPYLRSPRPPCCALDLRALSAFRILFMTFYLTELIVERISDVLSETGTRNENFAPSQYFAFGADEIYSIFFSHSSFNDMFYLLLMIVLSLLIICGYAKTPACLFLFFLDKSFMNRNLLALDEHGVLMSRMLLATAFTACDQVPINWSNVKRACCCQHSNAKRTINDQKNVRKQREYNYYDNSYGSKLIFVSVILLWLQIGWEKLMEWDHWWVKADAIQFTLIGNHCLPPARIVTWIQAVYLPRVVSQWLNRVVLLIEFPVGPLLMLWPSDKVRIAGLFLTGSALISFGFMVAVDWFPFCCFFVQIALFPALLMDKIGHFFLLDETFEEDEMEDKESKKTSEFKNTSENMIKGISYTSLPSITWIKSSLPSKKISTTLYELLLQYIVHGFLLSCVFCVIFCALYNTHVHRGESGLSIELINHKLDHEIVKVSKLFSLSTGWSAGSPPPTGVVWYVLVGYPSDKNTTWENEDDWGIWVQFQADSHSKSMEGKPIRHTFWEQPPGILCSGHRQFLVSKEKFYYSVFHSHASTPIAIEARQRILRQSCQDFHRRHSLPEQRLGSLKLFRIWHNIDNPWSYPPTLGEHGHSLLGHVECPNDSIRQEQVPQQQQGQQQKEHQPKVTPHSIDRSVLKKQAVDEMLVSL